MNTLEAQIEAILFTEAQPVRAQKLAQVLAVSDDELRQALDALSAHYQSTGSALTLMRHNDRLELVTRAEMSEALAAYHEKAPTELSKSALEVLAILAYHGPSSRAQIDRLRGVQSAIALRHLLARELAEERKRDEEVIYALSAQALKSFGVESAQDLPDFERFAQQMQQLQPESSQDGATLVSS